jgi:uncharacterized cupredoxin-like copper-binding protein
MRRSVSLSGLAMVAGFTLAACRSDRPTPQVAESTTTSVTPHPDTVTITATDYAFDGPAQVPAGATTMRLTNQGKQLHHAQLIKLEEGKTVDDVLKLVKTPGPLPPWIKFVGGPNAIPPGQQAVATAGLAPGKYAYVCVIPGADGVPHLAKGMIKAFEVTGPAGAAMELPAPDVTITLADYDFKTSGPLTPGVRTIRVENAGPQVHELQLLKLAPGKKVEDFGRWAETGMKGAPPAEPVGGVVGLDKGGNGSFTANLTAGDYGLICFVPDAKDGKPHLAHGMMKTIKVG